MLAGARPRELAHFPDPLVNFVGSVGGAHGEMRANPRRYVLGACAAVALSLALAPASQKRKKHHAAAAKRCKHKKHHRR